MLKGAIAGFGFISGKGHHPAYRQRSDVEIVAIADVCPARLEAARAAAPQARLYPDFRALLARGVGFLLEPGGRAATGRPHRLDRDRGGAGIVKNVVRLDLFVVA